MIVDFLNRNKDLALVLGMIVILVVLFAPIPPAFLDLAIIVNFGFALTILLLTFYVSKPVEFSTFPSLLLIATLFRLSMNVAATRLILTGGEAGDVIGSIGAFAVAGNFIVGFVVFSILIVVQYVVVTSGAQRVSEVAARFTLDSMPGQQMSIDADLNMGLIDQAEATRRREELEKEASFYGSMDGASKFVKGDSIAGIIILLIDIIAGWIIGVAQMGMGWGEALQRFSLLTIGDGIATQLPALIIAIATGIIVTRSSADRELSAEVFKQLSSVPRVPLLVSGMLLVLLLLPGMPKWPILILLGFAYLAWRRIRREAAKSLEAGEDAIIGDDANTTGGAPTAVEVALGPELSEAWKNQEAVIGERIANLRDAHQQRFGLPIPPVKLVDGAGIGPLDYDIRLFGTRYADGQIHPAHMLAISGNGRAIELEGMRTNDPAFGLPAIWIEEAKTLMARDAGYTLIDPITVLMTHLGELLKSEAATLLTRSETARLLEGVRQRQPGLVEELLPNVLTMSDVQRLLQNLLSEDVSIANIDIILEHLVDLARTQKDISDLTELVRQRMSYSICNQLKDRHKDLAVLSLDPKVENKILASVQATGARTTSPIDPGLAEQLIRKLMVATGEMHKQGRSPVLLCGAEIRRQLRAVTNRSLPRLSVLSVGEVPRNISLTSFDVVTLES